MPATLAPRGSGFVGDHAPDFLLANDSWSQLISFRTGPDGNGKKQIAGGGKNRNRTQQRKERALQ